MSPARDPLWDKRQTLRRHTRSVLLEPSRSSAHWSRLHAAMELPGSEPVQGALADLFHIFDASHTEFKRQALQLGAPLLQAHVARAFAAQIPASQLERITPLATRWSVLARPCADIPTRSRRCSADDSRALAQAAVEAMARADADAEQAFLFHCLTCHDKLAFMLARRALLRLSAVLPPHWEAASAQLEQDGGNT